MRYLHHTWSHPSTFTKATAPIVAWLILALAIMGASASSHAQDRVGWPAGTHIKIYINWDSFEAQGIPSSWKDPFRDAVINAYTRWKHVSGFDLDPKFYGYTTRTQGDDREIIISMNEQHVMSNRIASTFGFTNRPIIVFHRQQGSTDTDWDFTPNRSDDGKIDMQGILMHEFGHCWGLDHSPTSQRDGIMQAGYRWTTRFGPFKDDIADIVALYGVDDDARIKVKRSTNSGASWLDYSSNLSSLNIAPTIGPTAVRDPNQMTLFYTTPDRKPSWIVGDRNASSFDTSKWFVYGGLRSAYGTTGHGYDNEYMMAWVDDTDDHKVRIVFSSNGAASFVWRNPPADVRSYGTPAVHKLNDNTWLLAYTVYDFDDQGRTGQIATRVSTNDGVTWGPETILSTFYRSESGISVASNGPDDIRIGFSWSTTGSASRYRKRTIRAHVAGGSINYDGMIYESETTRTLPVMAKNSSRFLQAWREPNFLTSINTRRSVPGSTSWDDYRRAVESSPTTPSVAAYRNYSYAYLFYTE